MSEGVAVSCAKAELKHVKPEWQPQQGGVYRCPVDLSPEDGGLLELLRVGASLSCHVGPPE